MINKTFNNQESIFKQILIKKNHKRLDRLYATLPQYVSEKRKRENNLRTMYVPVLSP